MTTGAAFGREFTVIVTSEWLARTESVAVSLSMYVPGCENVAMVASASGFAKLTGAGPLSSLHETPSVDPTGRPSSEAAPARLAAAGNVIV